jgi:hypothetical protein
MANTIATKEAKQVNKKKFLEVDVWRSQFGQVSVRAIYDVFSTAFGIEPQNMKKYTLSQCINALRRLEDPDYEAPTDQSISLVE